MESVPKDKQRGSSPHRYSREFKLEAVRRLQQRTQSATQLAQELDIKRTLLYRWAEEVEAKGDAAFTFAPSASPGANPHDAELRRLRRELEQVREERDILKKAQAYFTLHRR